MSPHALGLAGAVEHCGSGAEGKIGKLRGSGALRRPCPRCPGEVLREELGSLLVGGAAVVHLLIARERLEHIYARTMFMFGTRILVW